MTNPETAGEVLVERCAACEQPLFVVHGGCLMCVHTNCAEWGRVVEDNEEGNDGGA